MTGKFSARVEAPTSPTFLPGSSPTGGNAQFASSPYSKIPRQRRRSTASEEASSPTDSLRATPYVPPGVRELAAIPKIEPDGSDPTTDLQYTVTISKRSNGNQPWEPSNVRPPMLGKMRRMTVQFAPFEGTAFEVLFQCKDLKAEQHEGRLIVASNDKGIARNSTTLPAQDERLFRTVVQADTVNAQAVTVYLKPCWKGFGTGRERPIFSVTVAVRPAEKECAFVILHTWNVELHSHKMESSAKGKSMDANGPFEVRGTIPLDFLQQPITSGVEREDEDGDGEGGEGGQSQNEEKDELMEDLENVPEGTSESPEGPSQEPPADL